MFEIIKSDLVEATFCLKPGINFLFGPNGSGKSMLLKGLASYTNSGRFGQVSLNIKTLYDFINATEWNYDKKRYEDDFSKIKIEDFSPNLQPKLTKNKNTYVIYFDGQKELGCFSFDNLLHYSISYTEKIYGIDSFLTLYSELKNKSLGERAKFKLERIFNQTGYTIKNLKSINKELKINFDSLKHSAKHRHDSSWFYGKKEDKFNLLEKRLTDFKEVTLIMDEPEIYLDIESQIWFWKRLLTLCEDNPSLQVLIVSHSLFFKTNIIEKNISDFNFLETKKDYLKSIVF